MKKSKKALLEKRGWKVGSTQEFLKLTPEEVALVEMKLALSEGLRERRLKQKITQEDVAKMLESSQSRVAKMEAADPSVSLDLLVRALLILGASRREIARVMSTSSKAA